jgi:squalene-hopene/tetraprenyl-beta-curcumene cyclase
MIRTGLMIAVLSMPLLPLSAALAQAEEQDPASKEAEKREKIKRLIELRDQQRARHERQRVQYQAKEMIRRGTRYLLDSQEPDGGWNSDRGPGITCLVVRALAQAPDVGPGHDAVKRGIEFVLRSQREDGGIYGAEGLLKNYESSVALSMFAVAKPPEHEKRIAALQKFLTDLQWDESEGKSIDDVWYGGAGYGQGKRPDLSNTQMMLEALGDSGLPQDHPAYRKALVFIQRCQMLGEQNDQPFAKGSNQGGFIYTPANGGESKADTIEIEGRKELRCYGSMTYAGFKSMLYCGLNRTDDRVKAAIDWIRRNWTLDHNPNMPGERSLEGVFYYYHVFARALAAYGQDEITDASGRKHDWRAELVDKLDQLQRQDGSWVNEQDRWFEGMPALTTAYALLALETAMK